VSGFRVFRIVEVRALPINNEPVAGLGPRVLLEMTKSEWPGRRHRTADWTLRLTARERQLVALLMEGCSNKSIAARLGVSSQTVKNQLSALYRKTGVGSRLELVLFAQRHGLGP
jgi:DNA-binding NarL/FixJ family response regulator